MKKNIENARIKRSVTLRKDGRYICYAKMNTSIKPQSLDRIEITYNKYYLDKFDRNDIRILDEAIVIDFVSKEINKNTKGYVTGKEFAKLIQIVKDVHTYYVDECILSKAEKPFLIAWDTVRRKIAEESTIKSPKKKEIALSEAERKNMEQLAMNEEKISNLIWALVNCTGLCVGEVSAITWNDVNLEDEVLFINKTVCSYHLRDKDGNRVKYVYDVGNTKTAHSEREVPLTENAITILKRIKKIQQTEGWYHPKQLLCYNGQSHKARNTLLAKELKELGKSIGISEERLHPHLLRKTVATVLHDAKMSTRDIADILGHSDISTTEKCYIISTEVEKKRKKMAVAL